MRTPAQTLEKLAELLPDKFLADYIKEIDLLRICGVYIVRAISKDIGNASFVAFVRKHFLELGYNITVSIGATSRLVVITIDKDGTERITVLGYNEWQALSEIWIQLLEKDN